MKKIYAFVALCFCIAWTTGTMAQTIKGTIKDSNGETLPGVFVKIASNGQGTASGLDGTYSIDVPVGDQQLEFILIGFTSQTIPINMAAGATKIVDVNLVEDSKLINDVVVVGYGVQRKRDVTGSIAKVDGKAVTKFPTPSFEAALQGQAAGVQVSQGSGLAGSGSLVRVRGVASISAGGDPLYVIDGIPITQDQFLRGNSGAMNTNPLAAINPNDIASIEILKDAAATGIYGSRGSNGVILITTKRGSNNKGTTFDFNTRFGVGEAASKPNMMNTEQYLAVRQEAWENDGGTGYVWLPNMTSASSDAIEREAAFKEAKKTNTDWWDQTTGLGFKQAYSFGANHNNGKGSRLYAGLSYDENGSYLTGNSFTRTGLRINFDQQITKKLKFNVGGSYTNSKNNRVDAAWSGGVGEAMSTALPYYKVYNDDGSYYMWNGGYSNPVAYRNQRQWQYEEDRYLINLGLVYSITPDLHFRTNVGTDIMRGFDYKFTPKGINIGQNDSYSEMGGNVVDNGTATITLDYFKKLKQHHNFTILGGYEMQLAHTRGFYASYVNADGLLNAGDWWPTSRANEDAIDTFDDSQTARLSGGSEQLQFGKRLKFFSFFSRVNYSYKDKFFAQVVARIDGSSKFGANQRTGFFPTFSAGWILSEEKFLKNVKRISFMKLSGGLGFVGNSDIAQDAQYGNTEIGGVYNGQPSLFLSKLPNPDLRWEKTSTLNAALETGLWKDRVTFEISVYRKYTRDALMDVSIPASTGFTNQTVNAAEILNRGIELTVTSVNISKPNFRWKTELNISRNYNELVSIGDYTADAVSGGTNDSRVIVGKPIGSFYLMQWSGVDPETGLPVYLDKNGNATSNYDNFQRQYVGDGLPDVSGGITNTFIYKNWDLQFFATFSLGAKIFDSSGKRQLGVVTDWNMRTDVLDRWQQPGDEGTQFARLTLNETTYDLPSGFPWWNTSLFIYDADYLRMKNIALGYSFKMKKESKIQTLRVGVNVTNLFTLTNYPGLDPEIVRDFENPADRNLSPNVTYLTPAQERSYNLSLSLTF
jgi:TonB-dependent starch-binding outer membrane protein SusC